MTGEQAAAVRDVIIGSIELIGVAHDRLGFVNPVTDWISNLNLNNVGFVIVAAFVAVWAVAPERQSI